MTDAAWEALSNQAVAAAGAVYFLALLAHLAEWSMLRKVAVTPARVAVGVGAPAAPGLGEESATGESTAGDAVPPRAEMLGRLGVLLTVIAVVVHAVSLVGRGMAADPNRVPWGNMYEFTLSGTFFLALTYLVAYRRFSMHWLAPLVTGFVLTTLMVAVIWLYAPVSPLTEALNSPWLVIHVVSAVIATGAFALGGMTSIVYLVKARRVARGAGSGPSYLDRVPDLAALDLVSYRLHAFAFPVWTFAVLITGPIWAHQAWSAYWNWDPKEVWSFITWVIYAAYLHARATAGWKGSKAAWLAVVGLATLLFNFIGINYFSTTTMHGYADADVSVVSTVEAGRT